MKEAVINGKPRHDVKSCFDCSYNKASLSWWCTNDEAIKHRGTRIPNIKGCEFWSPARTLDSLGFIERHFGDHIIIRYKQ